MEVVWKRCCISWIKWLSEMAQGGRTHWNEFSLSNWLNSCFQETHCILYHCRQFVINDSVPTLILENVYQRLNIAWCWCCADSTISKRPGSLWYITSNNISVNESCTIWIEWDSLCIVSHDTYSPVLHDRRLVYQTQRVHLVTEFAWAWISNHPNGLPRI